MYKKIFANTFASREDCEMFIMVLKQQWPALKSQLPGARIDIVQSADAPHVMQAVWTLTDRTQADLMTELARKLILPYRKQLSPKSVALEGEITWTLDF